MLTSRTIFVLSEEFTKPVPDLRYFISGTNRSIEISYSVVILPHIYFEESPPPHY